MNHSCERLYLTFQFFQWLGGENSDFDKLLAYKKGQNIECALY